MLLVLKNDNEWCQSIFLLLFFHSNDSVAQKNDSLNSLKIIAGLGNYEYLYSGINVKTLKVLYTEFAVGIKPWNFSNEFYAMAYLDAGLPLFNYEKHTIIKTYLQPKVLTWYFNNEFNRFVFIGIGGEIRLVYPITDQVQVAGTAGALYNLELYYERKTYEEVGYPKELQPSFSIQVLFSLP